MGDDEEDKARGKRSRPYQAKGSDYKPIKVNQATINIILLKSTLQTMQNIRFAHALATLWDHSAGQPEHLATVGWVHVGPARVR